MPTIALKEFGGEMPQMNAYELGPTQAQKAQNCKLWSRSLRTMRGLLWSAASALASTPQTIFKYKSGYWLEWATDVNAARALNANDALERVCYTGDGSGYPKVTDNTRAIGAAPYPSASLRLGVPAPTAAPTCVVGGSGSGTPDTRFYVYTYVNSYGEEGPPSATSIELTVLPGQYVDVTMTAAPGAPYNITKIRLYRSNTSDDAAQFQYVTELTLPTVIYNDAILSSALGEALPSETWDPPPADMIGLTAVSGGFCAGFRKNELLLSELGLMHAWPVDYRKSVDYEIVGIGVLDSGFAVLTKGTPYIAMGSNPSSVALVGATGAPYPCVSKRGIASIGGSVIYPSKRGLARIAPGLATLITELIFDVDDWTALAPASMRAFRWRNLYVCFYDAADGPGGFVIDPMAPEVGVVFFDGFDIQGGFFDVTEDALYAAVNRQIARWDAGADWPYVWQSKPFEMSRPAAMTTIQVRAEEYPVQVAVYRDGLLQAQFSVSSPAPARVINSQLGRVYSVELAGTKEVREVILASSIKEIQMAQGG